MLLLAFSACKKDDEDVTPACAASDWAGTYTGTADCDDGDEDVTLTITASAADSIIVSYEIALDGGGSVTTEYDPLPVNACDFSFSGTEFGITVSVDATLDDDTLTLTETFSDGTDTSTCKLTVTRN